MPATLPRLRNCCCLTIASASKLLSGLQGVQPMGKTPARDLPLGDLTICPAAAKARTAAHGKSGQRCARALQELAAVLCHLGTLLLGRFHQALFLGLFLTNRGGRGINRHARLLRK